MAFLTSWTLILVPQTKVGVASSMSSPSDDGGGKSSVEDGVAAAAEGGAGEVACRRPRLVERDGVGVDDELAKREGLAGGVAAAELGVGVWRRPLLRRRAGEEVLGIGLE